jgi:hypothetical protein
MIVLSMPRMFFRKGRPNGVAKIGLVSMQTIGNRIPIKESARGVGLVGLGFILFMMLIQKGQPFKQL